MSILCTAATEEKRKKSCQFHMQTNARALLLHEKCSSFCIPAKRRSRRKKNIQQQTTLGWLTNDSFAACIHVPNFITFLCLCRLKKIIIEWKKKKKTSTAQQLSHSSRCHHKRDTYRCNRCDQFQHTHTHKWIMTTERA